MNKDPLFFDKNEITIYNDESTHGLVIFENWDYSEDVSFCMVIPFHDLEQAYLKAKAYYEKEEETHD